MPLSRRTSASESRGPVALVERREAPDGVAGAVAPMLDEVVGDLGQSLPTPSAQVPERNLNRSNVPNHKDVRGKTKGNDRDVASAVLRDPDSNPYALLEGEGDLAETDLSEGMAGERRRRSRRRRNDQEPSVMDAAVESDGQAGPSENGLGERPHKKPQNSLKNKQQRCSRFLI